MTAEHIRMIAAICATNGELLESGMMSRAEFNEAMKDLAEIALDLLRDPPPPREPQCSNVVLFIKPNQHPRGN